MIRLAVKEDMPVIERLYADARDRMRADGNPTQWGDVYPPVTLLYEDIKRERLYVYIPDGENQIVRGVFAYIMGADPTYQYIEDGAWLSDTPYGTIHRIAGDASAHGVFNKCVDWAVNMCPHLRMDTHRNNKRMQHLAESRGFIRCGTIYIPGDVVNNDTARVAYELI